MDIADRINKRLRDLNLKGVDVGKATGVTSGAVSQWRKGTTAPTAARLFSLSKLLKCSPEWLQYGDRYQTPLISESTGQYGDAQEDVELPLYIEIEREIGSGITDVIENPNHKVRFVKAALERQHVDYKMAACCYVSGDSMEPILMSGSTVGINTAQTLIEDGKLYAINYAGMLRIKVLYRIAEGIKIHSINLNYPDIEVRGEDLEKFSVLGKVFWSASFHN